MPVLIPLPVVWGIDIIKPDKPVAVAPLLDSLPDICVAKCVWFVKPVKTYFFQAGEMGEGCVVGKKGGVQLDTIYPKLQWQAAPCSHRQPLNPSFVMRLIGPKAVEIAVRSYFDIL